MNCKIQQKETIQLIGKKIRVTIENEENKQKIPAFWEESNSNGFTDQLIASTGASHVYAVVLMDAK
ncbi:hypothetical protein [Bacillus atrophaeus]|uniref:GyrI-like domain-containing protein n=1 Tax=Bacillus atrophaeus TaxID=1452 RepID=UPI002E124271